MFSGIMHMRSPSQLWGLVSGESSNYNSDVVEGTLQGLNGFIFLAFKNNYK